MAAATIAAVGGLVSAGTSIFGGRKAKKDADRAAKQQEALGLEQANLIGMETEEELRRFDSNVEKTMSQGKAMSSASGFGSGGSQDIYMDNLANEFALERDWSERVSTQRQEIARRSGSYSADALRSQGSSALWSGVGQGIAKGIGAGGEFGYEMGWL